MQPCQGWSFAHFLKNLLALMPGNWSRLWSLRYIYRTGTLGNNTFFFPQSLSKPFQFCCKEIIHSTKVVFQSFCSCSLDLCPEKGSGRQGVGLWMRYLCRRGLEERGPQLPSQPSWFCTWCPLMFHIHGVIFCDLPPALGAIMDSNGIRVKERP